MMKNPKPTTKNASTSTRTNVNVLLKELTGPSKEARDRALRMLVTLGSPIREILATPHVVVCDGVYCTDEIAALIDEIGPSNPKVYTGLAKAVSSPDRRIRRVAMFICTEIKSPPVVVLKAIVTALTSDWRDDIRHYAAQSLGKIRSSAPVVLLGLATALQEYELSVLYEVMLTIRLIGVLSPELLAGLCEFLYRPNSTFCGEVLSIIEHLGTADTAVIAALQQLANGTFSYSVESDSGIENDVDYWQEQRAEAKEQYESNRNRAEKLLARFPHEKLVRRVAPVFTPPHPIRNEKDEHVIGLFKDVNLEEYLPAFHIFWCIGCVDRAAMQSAGPAMGVRKLVAMRQFLNPSFNHQPLRWDAEYLNEGWQNKLDWLFKRPPFATHAWSKDDSGRLLREQFERKSKNNMRGKGRTERRWTAKAWQAWSYVNRFLTIKGLLPRLDDDSN